MVRWSGVNPKDYVRRIQNIPAQLEEQGVQIVAEVVERAHQNQMQALEDATTATGAARMSNPESAPPGATAGRHLTGEMIDSTDFSVTVLGDKIVGTWGWDDPELYQIAQENGLGHVPAAGSLLTSFLVAEQDLDERLNELKGVL